jgi:hypothetical protein
MNLEARSGFNLRKSKLLLASTFGLVLLASVSVAQTQGEPQQSVEPKQNQQLQVNWLYGAFVPKDVPLQSLSNHRRFQLFLRQSFTTPGVYVKTALFSLSDQAANSPPEWGDGSVATPNGRVRVTDNSLHKTPYREWEMGCLVSSLDTIAASAPAFGRARDMLSSGTL